MFDNFINCQIKKCYGKDTNELFDYDWNAV